MTEDRSPADRRAGMAGRILVWSGRIVALLVIALSVVVAIFGLLGSVPYLVQAVAQATTLDMWAVLMGLELLFSLAVVIGVAFALKRRKLLPALLVCTLAWPMGFVIEGARCDTESLCRMYGWAAPPAALFDWTVRIRSVTDRREAEGLAEAALTQAGSDDHAFEPKRFGDHWLVPIINDDGWARSKAVRVDVRTAETRFVPCPADRMPCGMQRPVVSDGRRLFRDTRLRLSATFPAGLSVCSSWTDDRYEPWGFHAMHRPADIPCESLDQSRTLGLAVVETPLPSDCRPLPEASLRAFGGRMPGLSGRRVRVCQETAAEQLAIIVRANGKNAEAEYEAYLLTTREHLDEDAPAFLSFLETVKIGADA